MNKPAKREVIDITPCPCIIWVLSGRDPLEYHKARGEKGHQPTKKVA